MLLLALALSLTPLDVIIYETGGPVVIDQSDVDPDDDLIVRGAPPTLTDQTTLFVRDLAIVRSVTVDQGGTANFEDSTQVLTDVTIKSGGGAHLGDLAGIAGRLEVESGGAASCNSTATIGSVVVEQGGALNGLSGVTVLGDAAIVGESYLSFGATIQGTTTFDGSMSHLCRSATFDGPVELAAQASVRFESVDCHDVVRLTNASRGRFTDSTLHSGLTLEGESRVRLQNSNSIAGLVDLRASASLIVVLLASNYADGPILDSSGVVTGTDLSGAPLSFPFVREAGTELIVAIYSSSLGTSICAQSIPNTLGLFAQITASGSDLAAVNEIELTASNLPIQSFGYFFVGTQQGLVATPVGEVCVGGNIGRFVGLGQIMNGGSNGSYPLTVTGPIPGNPATAVVSGSTYIFQSWNREPILQPPANSRLSNAVRIQFR